MLAAVMFVIFAALAVIAGTASPVLRDQVAVQTNNEGKASFYLAESGVEDAAYRLKNNLPISASEQITLGNIVANTTIANNLTGKTITAEGDLNDLIRKISTNLQAGTGIDFTYAVQVGRGGFQMSNNSGVVGNIYSQGNVVGSNGAYVTGSVYAANGSDLILDQSNLGPEPPTQAITFADASANKDLAQSFQVSTSGPLTEVSLYLKKVSTPGNLTIRLTADNGGKPASSALDTATLSASLVSTSAFGWVEVVFPGQVTLTPGVTYWLVLDGSNSSTKYYLSGASAAYNNGTAKIGRYQSTWINTNPSGLDINFKIHLSGDPSTISGLVVGSAGVGDAWARTVNNSTVAGYLYCVNGSGNNKTCTVRDTDPSPQPFPISDANIADWEAEAAAGWTMAGNVNLINSESTTTGPMVITGNLTLSNNAVFTMTGTVYVKGDVTLANSAKVKLATSYGAAGGVLVTDGRVSVGNNALFNGSGQSGSYLLVVTNSPCPSGSNCDGSNAIDVSNNAGTVILNAQKGTISFSNNAGAKEATADKIVLSNNATITYDSGLASYNFISGPTGGFNLSGWGETQ